MAKRVAKFERVSYKQFEEDYEKCFGHTYNMEYKYEQIKLPQRATRGSAGYDFFSPFDFVLYQGQSIIIPTGIRCKMQDGWGLQIYPRSGLGFKHRLQLDNTVGIIDDDYYFSDNEGHIMIKLTNDSKQYNCVSIDIGKAFAQGIFIPYGITYDDDCQVKRNGGFGSTKR